MIFVPKFYSRQVPEKLDLSIVYLHNSVLNQFEIRN